MNPIHCSSQDGVDSNLIIMLHGFGDKPENFIKFGTGMHLPQTAVCALNAPMRIPFMDDNVGTQWFPMFDDDGVEVSLTSAHVVANLEVSKQMVIDFIKECIGGGKWPASRIFLIGSSQGASVVLSVAFDFTESRLGGIVCVGGEIINPVTTSICKTPCLFAARQPLPTKLAKLFTDFTFVKLNSDFPSSADEIKQLMMFFDKHLYLRNLALEAIADVVVTISV